MDDVNKATTNATESTRALLCEKQVQNIALALLNAPPPPRKLTIKEALDALATQIKEARGRGHTVDSIVTVLNDEGLSVSARAIAGALRGAASETTRARRAPVHKKMQRGDA